jgi:hypothetical protein
MIYMDSWFWKFWSGTYASYSPVLNALDQDTPLKLSLPATDYLITVTRILKSRQGVRPDSLVLRMVPRKVEQIDIFNQTVRAHPERVEKQVFFLKRNPDGSYGPPTLDGIMRFQRDARTGGEQLVYTFGQETRVLPGAQGQAQNILGEIARLSGESP